MATYVTIKYGKVEQKRMANPITTIFETNIPGRSNCSHFLPPWSTEQESLVLNWVWHLTSVSSGCF